MEIINCFFLTAYFIILLISASILIKGIVLNDQVRGIHISCTITLIVFGTLFLMSLKDYMKL